MGVIDPLLGPLGSSIGATPTHALLAGSPAIDAGDPSIVFNPAEFDQRGAPFVRVFDGGVAGQRIDIGATERQTLPGFNQLVVDTTVDEYDGDFTVRRPELTRGSCSRQQHSRRYDYVRRHRFLDATNNLA